MPAKFKRCVTKVTKQNLKIYGYQKYNPFAVCRKSTNFYGNDNLIKKRK